MDVRVRRAAGLAGARRRARLEALGYAALWVPEGSSSRDVFAHLSLLLSATEQIAVASGIANITARQPEVMAQGGRTLADAYGERVVIGIGVGHEYSTEARGIAWDAAARTDARLPRPDGCGDVGMDPPVDPRPPPRRARRRDAAAVGERALGAHTYFVPVAHTAHARAVLGPEPVLAVELTAVPDTDPDRARGQARAWAMHYLELPNYAKNLVRMGASEETSRRAAAIA